MAAVAWPLVRARLAAALPAVVGPSVRVYDGPVVGGDDPAAYLSIAHAPSLADESAGSFTQGVDASEWSATEDGEIRCELAAVTGASIVPSVFDTFDLIAAFVQSDPTLGGVLPPAVSTVTVAGLVVAAQNDAGAVQRLIVTFSYSTRIV